LKSKTKSIKAHKIILAEASPIFGKMMKEHHSKVLQLKDLSMEHLTEILNFIYDGEISTDKLKLHIKFLLKAAIDVIVELWLPSIGVSLHSGMKLHKNQIINIFTRVIANLVNCWGFLRGTLEDYIKECWSEI
jgi:uncharacterized membrane protein YqaE (UPF0057 family)